jgi:hypothetical protein
MSQRSFPSHLINESWDSIYGTEQELFPWKEYTFDSEDDDDFFGVKQNQLTFPTPTPFFNNGGKAYLDCNIFYEVATPECANPLAAVIYDRAMIELALSLNKEHVFFRNGADHSGHTSGFHENYLTTLSTEDRVQLIPFFLSLQPLIGAGLLDPEKRIFRIHQRASHIKKIEGSYAHIDRAILDLRNEPLSSVDGFFRLHHVLNDPSLCPAADLLRIGATALVIQGFEEGSITPLDYDQTMALNDLTAISESKSKWVLDGIKPKPLSALSVQEHFLSQVKDNLKTMSPLRQYFIDLWEEGLNRLSQNDPHALIGFSDWATKGWLIGLQAKEHGCKIFDDPCLAIDSEYHQMQFGVESLFDFLQNDGTILHQIPKEHIRHAAKYPPRNTRAHARSVLLKEFQDSWSFRLSIDWDTVTINRISSDGKLVPLQVVQMPDPRNSYVYKARKAIRQV